MRTVKGEMGYLDSFGDMILRTFDFRGQISRAQFARAFVMQYAIVLMLVIGNINSPIFAPVLLSFQLFVLLPLVAMCARRLRTMGKSPWLSALWFTGIGMVYILVICMLPEQFLKSSRA